MKEITRHPHGPRRNFCGRVPGWLVSHFLSFVSHFFSSVSHFLSTSFAFVARFSPNSLLLGVQFFLKMCPPFVSLLVSAHFHWPCSMSIHLSPRSVTQHFFHLSPRSVTGRAASLFISQVCHCWRSPFSAGHVAFLFICLPGLSIHFSPRSVTAGVRPCPLHFYSFVSQACHPFPQAVQHFYSSPRSVTGVSLSIGHEAFLFICLRPSLLVPCSISIHLFSRSVTAGVRPFPLAMQHFYSFVSRVCHWCCRPFPLAM